MSGLCGWFGARPDERASTLHSNPDPAYNKQTDLDVLEAMAAPLQRFDASIVQRLLGKTSAVQTAAQHGSAHLYQQDGLLIAIWGSAVMASEQCSPAMLDSEAQRPASEAGAPPRSASPSELGAALAQLWRTQGPKACAALSGAFALCIVDEVSGEALLAIDRSGTHTLSYQNTASGLVFASSGAALMAHPATQRKIHPQALYDYLYFHAIPAPLTIYAHQQRLLPGQYLHFKHGQFVTGKYWQITFQERAHAPFDVLKQQFLSTLRTSVHAAIGGQEVGAFLSGGTDSTTLSIILGQVSGAPARTYSIGFDAPGYDEMAYARIAARHCRSVHHEYYVTPDDVVDAIPQIAAVFDQPFGNASAVPAFFCAKMAAADGVTRLLGGDGGDELFGGNERYARQALFARYERVPMLLRQCLIEPVLFKFTGQHALFCKARSYIEQALVPLPGRLETYNLLQHYGSKHVLEAQFLAKIDPGLPLSNLNDAYWLTHGHSQINQMLALDLKYTLADNDLPKVVKACELAGVEVAFPFLNDAMVAFSSRLTPRQKLNGTRLRYFFKQALSDILPRAILRKQKHGFGLPFGLWLQQHHRLREIAFDSLSDLKQRGIVRPEFIDDLQQRHLAQHPGYHGTMVWVLMMLEQWFQQHPLDIAESGTRLNIDDAFMMRA